MNIIQQDALEFLKSQADNSADVLFCDPPYALGSEIVIREDGKPDYSKAVDFMNKWKMPTGEFWEEFYKEAYRVLKYGGHCLMYGMDRQNFMFKYYGHLAGFQGKQSIYWYFISNFPKASDLSKNIDKNAGAEREVVGSKITGGIKRPDTAKRSSGIIDETRTHNYSIGQEEIDITAPSTPLAKKYSGYKYSVAPLKQVVEEVMVSQKPYKTKSCLHDTLAMENGDESITCGALDIDGNRVAIDKNDPNIRINAKNHKRTINNAIINFNNKIKDGKHSNLHDMGFHNSTGRYPAQAFLTGTEEILDRQSGVSKGGSLIRNNKKNPYGSDISWSVSSTPAQQTAGYTDTGGCSKVLHKCQYETEEYDLFIYSPKVSKKERNAGCEDMEEKQYSHDGREKPIENPYQRNDSVAKNTHPTLKPISLNEKILRLFKTPNPQTILIPFAGSGSEIIGAMKAKFEDIRGCEINEEYVKIAEARIKYYEKELKQKLL